MKMKRAAVSLVESSTEHIKRRKSFSRKHSKHDNTFRINYRYYLCYTLQFYLQNLLTLEFGKE